MDRQENQDYRMDRQENQDYRMDRQENQGVVGFPVSFLTAILVTVYFFVAAFLVAFTNLMEVPKSVILLEGMYFAVAYYLRTLDGYGARVLAMGHICSIATMLTNLRAASVLTLTWLATFYPVYSLFNAVLVICRLAVSEARNMPELLTPETAESFHILMLLGYITYYYIFEFTHKSRREDPVMVMAVLWTLLYIPDISHRTLCILATTAGLWIEKKSFRIAPRSQFPIRTLASTSFFR